MTDPGSPLDESARAAGYRVFNADPNVGGRYSALTAFGLVPSGLAGVDISEILDEAETIELSLAIDSPENPGLVLGAAIAATAPLRDKLAIVADGTHIVGFADWAEQLIAESTGKEGTGILPVVLDTDAPELTADLPDVQVVRLVDDAGDQIFGRPRHRRDPGVAALSARSCSSGSTRPPSPDASSASTRSTSPTSSRRRSPPAACSTPAPRPSPPRSSRTASRCAARPRSSARRATSTSAIDVLLEELPENGYISVQAYVDRVAHPELARIRDLLAARSGRPVTFGWGPRFLHSTGQFHKGGPAVGVFLQITQTPVEDLAIPERPFTFGQLIAGTGHPATRACSRTTAARCSLSR